MARLLGWTREEAFFFLNWVREPLDKAGAGIALAGSLLVNATSRKDLDFIIFPKDSTNYDIKAVENALWSCGLRKEFDVEFVRERWKSKGSRDRKRVDVWSVARKRIDIFWLS